MSNVKASGLERQVKGGAGVMLRWETGVERELKVWLGGALVASAEEVVEGGKWGGVVAGVEPYRFEVNPVGWSGGLSQWYGGLSELSVEQIAQAVAIELHRLGWPLEMLSPKVQNARGVLMIKRQRMEPNRRLVEVVVPLCRCSESVGPLAGCCGRCGGGILGREDFEGIEVEGSVKRLFEGEKTVDR